MSERKLTYSNNMTLISLSSLPCDNKIFATILKSCAEKNINIDTVSQTARKGGSLNMSFTLSDEYLGDVLLVLGELRALSIQVKPEILPSSCKINFFDETMATTPGVASTLFSALSDADVEIMLVTTSDVDITVFVPAHCLSDAVSVLEKTFDIQSVEETIQ